MMGFKNNPRQPMELIVPKRRVSVGQFGQALVELALVAPILLTLALGVVEIGRYAYIAILVGNAARAGTAYGAQSLPASADSAGIRAAVKADFAGSASNNGLNASTLTTVNSSVACGCDNGGTITTAGCGTTTDPNPTAGSCTTGHWVVVLSVTAGGTFNALFNYPGIPASIAVTRLATMRVAQN
jgi:Flp pilus assembly protein TadG